MILLGILLLGIAILVSTNQFKSAYQDRAMKLEAGFLMEAQKGLHKEFVFLDFTQLKKYTRYFSFFCFVVSLCTKSFFPFLIGVISFWWLPSLILYYVKRRRRLKFEKQFANILPQIASILRAGHTFERALQSIAESEPDPLSQELELVLKELRMGESMEEALNSLLKRFPDRDLEILIRAISISRRVGSNLAEVFSTVSDMIQNRYKLRDKLAALTAQGKTQAIVAILMPVGLTFAVHCMDPGYLDPLFFTFYGKIVLATSVCMLGLGGFWINKICKMELIR